MIRIEKLSAGGRAFHHALKTVIRGGAAGLLFLGGSLTAQTIYNPSFESNTFTVFPGYCSSNSAIAGWTVSDPGHVGQNPASGSPFADNGAIPDGANAAFIQTTGTPNWLATTISNLAAGTLYRVSCRVNSRASYSLPVMWLNLNGAVAYTNTVPPVGTDGNPDAPYAYADGLFTATSNTAPLAVGCTTDAVNSDGTVDGALLLDDFQITALTNYFTLSPWIGDPSAGVNPTNNLWACAFGTYSGETINGVTFTPVPGGNPALAGVFAVSGDTEVYTGETPVYLSGTGSLLLATNFVYGGNPATVTVFNLTAGVNYRLTFYGVGFDGQGNRYATFSGTGDSLYLDEDLYGQGCGLRVDYNFTAVSTNAVVTITPTSSGNTFHLHGLALSDSGPPVLASQPAAVAAVAGAPAQMAVTVLGTAPFAYQWYEQGVGALAGATNAVLTWSSVAPSNAGSYYAVVTNAAGSVTSSNAVLAVFSPPTITCQPANLAAFAGTPAQLSVTAASSVTAQYQWYRHGAGALAGATNAVLAWSSLAVTNAAAYYVVVGNAYGSVTSREVLVDPVLCLLPGGNPVTNSAANPYADSGAVLTTPAVGVAGGWLSSMALLADGTVTGWGSSTVAPPASLTNAVAIAMGAYDGVALLSDNSLTAWGATELADLPAAATNVVSFSARGEIGAALRADGSAVGWGYGAGSSNSWVAQLASFAANLHTSGATLQALAVGDSYCLMGLNDERAGNYLCAFGDCDYLAGVTYCNPVALAAGDDHGLVLLTGGTLQGFGDCSYENYSAGNCVAPARATNVTAIAAGEAHCLALRADGSVLSWGLNICPFTGVADGVTNVPAAATNVVAIAAGEFHNLVVRADGSVLAWGWDDSGQTEVPSFSQTNWAAVTSANGNGSCTQTYFFTNAWGGVLTTNRTVYGVSSGSGLPVLTNLVYAAGSGVLSFDLAAASGQSVIVETCTNLAGPVWVPLQTNTLNSGTAAFSVTNSPAEASRFYRLLSP
jgi:hypothetical protein